MALNIEQKKTIVADLNKICSSAVSVVAADYRGLTVSEMTSLRAKAREQKIYVKIIRNTLTRKAISGTDFACLEAVLTGPIILIFSQDELGAGARLVRDFIKEYEKLVVKGLVIGGELLDVDQLKKAANLPTREQALTSLVSVMKAPIAQLARTATEVYGQFVRVVQAVAEKKKQSND